MEFAKYDALGNDYVVLDLDDVSRLKPELIRLVCDRHHGLGADGILVAVPASSARFAVRIFNPDGSEAEKSGNGLRIFARWLADRGRVGAETFAVETRGGGVTCRVDADRRGVTVGMGPVQVGDPARSEVVETLDLDGVPVRVVPVSLGNPHCVVLDQPVDAERVLELGPRLERHPRFPHRTNVQLLAVESPELVRIEIWERGAGRTLASGSSACAAAAAARRLGLAGSHVWVRMPGGDLRVRLDGEEAELLGPVAAVASGRLADELLA